LGFEKILTDKKALLDLESTHLEKMKRFALATAKAMAFSGTSPEAQKNSDAIDKRQYIRLSFGEEPSFVVPWLACHTWNVCQILNSSRHIRWPDANSSRPSRYY